MNTRDIVLVGMAASHLQEELGITLAAGSPMLLAVYPAPYPGKTCVRIEMPQNAVDKIMVDPESFREYAMKEMGIEISGFVRVQNMVDMSTLFTPDRLQESVKLLKKSCDEAKPFIPKESSFERANRGSPHLLKKRGWRHQ